MQYEVASREELNDIEEFKTQFYSLAKDVLGKSASEEITPKDVDSLFDTGRDAYKKGEVGGRHVCFVCGIGLGELMMRHFVCDWYKLTLEDGTERPCIGNGRHYIHPVNSFEMRIDSDEINFAQGLFHLIGKDGSLVKR